MNKTRNLFIKQLIHRSKYSGSKESDIILNKFAKEELNQLSDLELLSYKNFLKLGDLKIWEWVSGIEPMPIFEDKNFKKFINIIKNL